MSWLVVQASRTLTEDVPAPPEQVRAFYVDLDNIRLVHPLIVSVQVLTRTDTTDGFTQIYRVRDRIPLGPLQLPISYMVRLWVPNDGEVETEARQFPMVRLGGRVTFDPIGTGTRITEHTSFSAPRPLAAMTVRGAAQSHIAMLAGIRSHFEDANQAG